MLDNLILKDKLTVYALYAFAFSISLGQKLSTITILIWLVFSLISLKPKKFTVDRKLLVLPVLYGIYVISLIYTENFSFKYFEQKASLLAFPLLFFLNSYKYNKETVNKTLLFFVIGCLVSAIYSYANAFLNALVFENNTFAFKPQVDVDVDFLESSIKGGNYFYGNYFSVLHQTVYYAMFLCLAIAILLFKSNILKRNIHRLLAIAFLSLTVLQVSSRAGVATLFVIIIIYLYTKFSKKLFVVASAFVVLVMLPALLLLNPRLKNAAKNIITSGVSFHNEDNNSASLRIMTWDASIQVIKNNPIIGVGVGDAYDALKEEYRKKRYVTPYRDTLNSHNQYFQFFVECGIVALIIFFSQLLLLLKEIKLKKELGIIILMFLIIISFNALFESIFNHYSGIMFYSFFFCLLMISKHNHSEAL